MTRLAYKPLIVIGFSGSSSRESANGDSRRGINLASDKPSGIRTRASGSLEAKGLLLFTLDNIVTYVLRIKRRY